MGATEVVPETLEAGLMVASHVLLLLGESTDAVTRNLREIRHDRYRLLRALFPGAADTDPSLPALRAVTLAEDADIAGRQLDIQALERLGVSTPRVKRGDRILEPPADGLRLQTGDVVVLAGTPDAPDQAEARLVRGRHGRSGHGG